jgi:dTMP kinase
VGDRLRAALLDTANPLEAMTELFVVCAARAEHVRKVIGPALDEGRVVLCDRFADATVAYQGYGRGIDLDIVRRCSGYAAGGLVPNLTLLVDVPPNVSRDRVEARSAESGVPADRMEREGAAFHDRVRAGYLAIVRDEPGRVKVLDGALPPEALIEAAWEHVASVMGAG